jgi:hypothetical protein
VHEQAIEQEVGHQAQERLLACLDLICTHKLADLNVHFQSWARHDPVIRRRVQRVIRQRLDFFREVFAELGFSPQAVEMRARLVLGYEANERLLFHFKSDKEARNFREMRCELLLAPEP